MSLRALWSNTVSCNLKFRSHILRCDVWGQFWSLFLALQKRYLRLLRIFYHDLKTTMSSQRENGSNWFDINFPCEVIVCLTRKLESSIFHEKVIHLIRFLARWLKFECNWVAHIKRPWYYTDVIVPFLFQNQFSI